MRWGGTDNRVLLHFIPRTISSSLALGWQWCGSGMQGLSLIRTFEKKRHSYIFVHFRTYSYIFVHFCTEKKKAKSR